MDDLKGRTAFITGAASGIGLGMATALSAAGANVALADMDEKGLDRALAELNGKGADARGFAIDVRSQDSWQAALDQAERCFGSIHIFCSNAGVGAGRNPVEERTVEDLDWVWDVNARGMFLGVKTVLPRMRRHGEGGHIVITSSMMGLFTMPQSALYAMSKYAATGLAETLFLELKGSSIDVSLLCPGITNTSLLTNVQKNMPSQRSNRTNEDTTNLLAAGMSPRAIGERVVKAIRNKEFYIITHPEYRPFVADRCAMLLAAFGESASPGHVDNLSIYTTYSGASV
jgi:NAD(P)-dependent dehydrogenase (short-subunit alcohol dehydrogenase family)